MKRKMGYVLDEKDDRAVQLLADLGMPKNLAKTLMYISQVEECQSVDIEKGADLRQPEVSQAMQELRKKGWVEKQDLKKEGKGRPVHLYKSKITLADVVKELEEEKLKEVENVKKDLSQLKKLLGD
jgi:predicted transcriptional regulator